jgi:spore coat protein YsxE
MKGVVSLDRERIEMYVPILQQYGLKPFRVDDYGKVKKVHTNAGLFALKEITNAKEMAAVQQSYMLYGKQLIPLYLSRQGLPFVSHGRHYYLMPWIAMEKRTEKHEQIRSFFRTLAYLHQTSLKQIEVREEEIRAYYERKKQEWEQQRSFLQAYIEKCENTWYMSPFQLQCCTYFHEIMQAYWFAETELEKWYEKIKETKKWRIAWIHGKARLSHYLETGKEQCYFFSWERASWNSPLFDVIIALRYHTRTFPPIGDEWLEGVEEYEKTLSLLEEERSFFFSHLAQPNFLYRCMYEYETKRQNGKSEQEYVSELQRLYFAMKNMEYIVMRLVQQKEVEEAKSTPDETPPQ